MEYETYFDPSGVECPCGEEMHEARYVEQVQSTAVGAPVGYVDGDVVESWRECLECGHLNCDLADLPESARQDWLEAFE